MMFITENVPPNLRGELTKWMLQLKAGVFIGTLSTLVGEKLWKKIQEKQGKGGAIWVKGTNNEQKFKVSTSGIINWIVNDFEGLQLITHPHKKSRPKKSINRKEKKPIKDKNIEKKTKKRQKTQKIPLVTWNTEGTPDNFITRTVIVKNENSNINTEFTGTSAYGEYPPNTLWVPPWTEEIKHIGEALLKFLLNLDNLSEQSYFEKKILCLDIETTDYIPKAYEGFINIIGITLLDLRKSQIENLRLNAFQVFNTTRKKLEVPTLLTLIDPYLKDIDVLLVFNKDFDLKILNTIINEFSLKLVLPKNVVDLQDYFPNLKALEQSLTARVGVRRTATEKGKYSEYYKLFKGQGREGHTKKIEPIGTYNLTDTLTPLFMYLLLNKK
ncbi:MAG: type I-E CRISPR-associated endoribonuclease Cas2e [Promethearchaeota archaeon]